MTLTMMVCDSVAEDDDDDDQRTTNEENKFSWNEDELQIVQWKCEFPAKLFSNRPKLPRPGQQGHWPFTEEPVNKDQIGFPAPVPDFIRPNPLIYNHFRNAI